MTETTSGNQRTSSPAIPQLQRVLGLWDLIFYGIVLIQPIAAVGLLGVGMNKSQGHMTTTILIAMIAMMLTAISYGRMASLYPSAGSAYTYVGRGINPHLGFLAGWAMFLDYLVVPVLNLVFASLVIDEQIIPLFTANAQTGSDIHLAPWIWVILLGAGTTFLNWNGIKATAKSNIILLVVMCAVILIFIVDAIRFTVNADGVAGLFSLEPIYNPKTFKISSIGAGTAFVALTYIGFDGVTTLAEDVKNPKRNVLLATVLVCLFTGLSATLEIYLAQIVWPDYQSYPNEVTAFMDVCARVGGRFLSISMSLILFVACFGSALTGQVGAARLLFGMGRDGALPKKFFSHLDTKRNTPTYNIIFIGLLATIVAVLLEVKFGAKSYETSAELLNFGAFLAFMGVNLATLRQFYFLRVSGHKRNLLRDAILPIVGFIFCAVIWLYLSPVAKTIGGIWFVVGGIYLAITTKGFRKQPAMIDFREG